MTGQEAEDLFYDTMQSLGKTVRRATEEENIKQQFDIVCDGVKYDVKAPKKLNRGDTCSTNILWVELYNVLGNRGWIKGEADRIAFLKGKEFITVDREELYQLVRTLVTDLNIYSKKGYCKLYRRKGRKDIVTYIDFSDITTIIKEVIKIKQ